MDSILIAISTSKILLVADKPDLYNRNRDDGVNHKESGSLA
jgi:hypothetical protein